LPWRKTNNPYKILVSEIMLQQTQVDRVIQKYKSFLERFPTVKDLAAAPLGEVLVLWKGLGYNNRAKRLRDAAKIVMEKYKGKFPKDPGLLEELPGIGPYTARAVIVFSYNSDTYFIETNIRRVFIHEFFAGASGVHDRDIMPLVELTLPSGKSKEWYGALMDYGTHLARQIPNPNRRSRHYAKQSRFEGSLRQGRARVLHMVTEKGSLVISSAEKLLEAYPKSDREKIISSLIRDGVLMQKGKKFFLAK
jgi:A/G-specific adenine glycosylase